MKPLLHCTRGWSTKDGARVRDACTLFELEGADVREAGAHVGNQRIVRTCRASEHRVSGYCDHRREDRQRTPYRTPREQAGQPITVQPNAAFEVLRMEPRAAVDQGSSERRIVSGCAQ